MSLVSNSAPSSEVPVVLGLSMRMGRPDTSPAVLGGPAIYAALGVRMAGVQARLMSAVGCDMSPADDTLLRAIDDTSPSLVTRLKRATLVWQSAPVLGERGQGVLSDDPGLWRAAPSSPDIFNDRPLILANGDPDWYQQLLVSAQPAIVFMDLHLQWLRVREKALNACLRRTNVVTVTETEYKAMPVTVKSGLILRSEQHALILKRGAQGVTLIVGNEERALPPPAPTQVNTDVGCGDHLLGLLAGHFIRSGPALAAAPLIDRLSQAYLASLAGLERLMESDSAYAFSWQSLQRIAAGDAWSAVDISGPMQAREDEHETN